MPVDPFVHGINGIPDRVSCKIRGAIGVFGRRCVVDHLDTFAIQTFLLQVEGVGGITVTALWRKAGIIPVIQLYGKIIINAFVFFP